MNKSVGALAASLAFAASASSEPAPGPASPALQPQVGSSPEPCAFAESLRDAASVQDVNLPAAARPSILDAADANLTILDLAPNRLIDHAFAIRAVIDLDRNEVWLRRSGGYTGQEEWRGPLVLARNVDLAACKGRKRREVLM